MPAPSVVWRFEVMGESALRATPARLDITSANAVVHAAAFAIRRAAIDGVRDVVPGLVDLLVHVDPLRCDLSRVTSVIEHGDASGASAVVDEAVIEVPLRYGGDEGPDLDAVAVACGLTPAQVCARHAAAQYTVWFVGFQPGFPYLGPLDPSLRIPRRQEPRPRVEAGSVAIAGEFAGIYPAASPGGWHVIGRTDFVLFDERRDRPALLTPGRRVRFVPQAAP